ncbi:MAG: nitroreductase family protein [Armatimonadota bacterium]|nr:nitroreductase family protein [Armatimonadota bacterium]MCX7778005.1 nitroreductase family protein [Armatimonadota bacterium]MDW8026020.1 nitroreductase family protein [Armatimonadota bacterium]
MELFEVFRRRHSIRAYSSTEIPDEVLRRILEAANSAPSAGNLQAYEIVVVKDAVRKQQLAHAAYGQTFIAQAPVVLVFVQNPHRSAIRYGQRGATLYSLQDATIACTHAHLAATALGLGSCWVGAFDDDAVARAINATRGMRPVAILPIGYPAEQPWATPRRSLDDIVHWETL